MGKIETSGNPPGCATEVEAAYVRLEQSDYRQSRVRHLRLAVVGLGALGSEAVRLLCLLGAGTVILVDFDTIETANLPWSMFFRKPGRTGVLKTAAIGEAVREYFPSTSVAEFPCEIADLGFGILRGTDLIFSCVDSEWARLDIAYVARELSIPVIDAGLGMPNYRQGRVSFFGGAPAAPCFSCLLSSSRRRALLTESQQTHISCSSRLHPETEDGIAVATPMMASIIASLQVDYGLRELWRGTMDAGARHAEMTGGFTVNLDLMHRNSIECVTHHRAGACPFHEPCVRRVEARPDQTPAEILGELDDNHALLLDWPLCVRCRCRACGYHWRPVQRAALVRRRGRCPACGLDGVEPLETVSLIRREEHWAEMPFSALGLPDRHLHAVVRMDG